MSTQTTTDDSATDGAVELTGGLAVTIKPCENGAHLTVHGAGRHPASAGIRAIVTAAEPGAERGGQVRVPTRSRDDIGPTLYAPDRATANLVSDRINQAAAEGRQDAIAP